MPLNRASNRPLHLQIQQEIGDLIGDRTFQPGDRLPTETQLAEKFEVNRLTIRQAVADLRRQGLIVVRQGSGTFVADLPAPLEIDLNPDEWLVEHDRSKRAASAAGREMSEQLLDCDIAAPPQEVAQHLGKERMLWIETRHFIDGLPSIRSQYWTRSKLSPENVRERYGGEFDERVLLDIVGQPMYYQWRAFDAVSCDQRNSQVLEAAPGSPILRRTGLNSDAGGNPLLYLNRDAPSGRMILKMHSRPGE